MIGSGSLSFEFRYGTPYLLLFFLCGRDRAMGRIMCVKRVKEGEQKGGTKPFGNQLRAGQSPETLPTPRRKVIAPERHSPTGSSWNAPWKRREVQPKQRSNGDLGMRKRVKFLRRIFQGKSCRVFFLPKKIPKEANDKQTTVRVKSLRGREFVNEVFGVEARMGLVLEEVSLWKLSEHLFKNCVGAGIASQKPALKKMILLAWQLCWALANPTGTFPPSVGDGLVPETGKKAVRLTNVMEGGSTGGHKGVIPAQFIGFGEFVPEQFRYSLNPN
nr:hypothetical protein Iba_chr08dCG3160 [Ipomoea batatas]